MARKRSPSKRGSTKGTPSRTPKQNSTRNSFTRLADQRRERIQKLALQVRDRKPSALVRLAVSKPQTLVKKALKTQRAPLRGTGKTSLARNKTEGKPLKKNAAVAAGTDAPSSPRAQRSSRHATAAPFREPPDPRPTCKRRPRNNASKGGNSRNYIPWCT